MSGTKRKHAEDTGLSVDDFTGTAETTIVTTNVDACAAVIRAFSGADKFSIESYTLFFKDRLDLDTRSADSMLSIIDHFRHGENYRLTVRGNHDIISKGWNTIKLATREKSDETERGDSNNSEIQVAPKLMKRSRSPRFRLERVKTEPKD